MDKAVIDRETHDKLLAKLFIASIELDEITSEMESLISKQKAVGEKLTDIYLEMCKDTSKKETTPAGSSRGGAGS